ncbi:MAG: tRNA lysidine(34) synthetase TilS [Candidatus Rokubacteria bacterium]|nr:tRNA lysidine(34) synthetase TilS [Candidatus Rokubacteria bacterium]
MGLAAAVERTLRRHAMLAGGETVLVAVSGGADSVALLHCLRTLAPAWRLTLHVLHVDHRLRPDSRRDAELVLALAARLGVPAEAVEVTVRPGGSLEAAARAARYAALEACAERVGAHRIALGHTADDQAETVLMRLLEGAGVRGLAGIPAVRAPFIRPLIACRRAELVAELARAGLAWAEDPTNRDPRFLRNRIRHELLPLLEAAWDPAIRATLARVARHARDAVTALDRMAAAELERHATFAPGTVTLPRAPLAGLPAPVAAEVLRQAAARLGGHAPLRAWAHRGLRRVLAPPPPRRPLRLGGLTIEVSGPLVRLASVPPAALPPREVGVPGRVGLPEIGAVLEARVLAAEGYAVPSGPDRVAFDADLVSGPLTVRGRRVGDSFTAFGGGARRLKTFLIDAKVPRWERARVPLVEARGEIVWVAGLRRGAAAPLGPGTRRVLELALIPAAESR